MTKPISINIAGKSHLASFENLSEEDNIAWTDYAKFNNKLY